MEKTKLVQNKLTVEECRKYLPADIKITDTELNQIRDFFYNFAEMAMLIDRKEIA